MILNSPYPVFENKVDAINSALLVGSLVYLFVVVFQPFGTQQWEHEYKYTMLTGYGFIGFSTFFLEYLIFSRNISKPHKWTVLKEIIKISFLIIIASVFNYLYYINIIVERNFLIFDFLYMILLTFFIGLPICTIYILSNYLYLNNKYSYQSKSLNDLIFEKSDTTINSETIIDIITENKKIGLSIFASDFLYAESADNYCIIYYLRNEIISKEMLRLSLSNLEKQIENKFIKRSHRSYIINLNRVNKIEGNAQGYKLFFSNSETFVLVSRNYIPEIMPLLNKKSY